MHIKSERRGSGLCGCSLNLGISWRPAFLCRIFVSASYLTSRHWEKSDGIIHAKVSSHGQDRLSTCFTAKSEARCCNVRYICHRQTTATSSQQGKHHKSPNQHKHALPHINRKPCKHEALGMTHYSSCPRGNSLHCNSLLRREAYNSVSFGCTPTGGLHLLSARG